MKWLQPGPNPHQTALAMIGAKSGQQVLIFGAGDGHLAAEVGAITGLNGRTDVVDPLDAARAVVEAAASTHGVILGHHASSSTAAETAEGGAFDIVVLNRALAPPNIPAMLLRETAALLRQGGRVIVIEGGMTPGVLGVGRRPIPPAMPGDAIRDLLSSASFRAARVLAESEGAVYVEAQEP